MAERTGLVVVASLCLPPVTDLRRQCHRHHFGCKIFHRPYDRTIRKRDSVDRIHKYSSSSTTWLKLQKHDNEKSSSHHGSSPSSNQDAGTLPTEVETVVGNESSIRWQANDFDNDRRLLETAIARESSMSDLQQQQRKYTLDYGFAQNRRPLVRDALLAFVKADAWLIFLGSACDDSAFGDGSFGIRLRDIWARPSFPSTLRELHVLIVKSIFTLSTFHHWIVGVALPLIMLLSMRYGILGPDERILDEYSTYKPGPLVSNVKSLFYSSSEFSNRRARDKDTGNFVLCLLENWSSAIVLPLVMRVYSSIVSPRKKKVLVSGSIGKSFILSRLITRVGAAAALHQYPSLLFELRRSDRPRPTCRSLLYMQRAEKVFFNWLTLGVASDLAVLLGTRCVNSVTFGTIAASLVSVIPSLCHMIALGRIVRITKCTSESLSAATVFPSSFVNMNEYDFSIDNHRKKVQWRYRLRWRTPQRLLETIRTWKNYFFTGHVPLLLEMDEWKKQPIQFDDFTTEGTQYKFRDRMPGGDFATMRSYENENNDCMPDTAAIADSLSLIFRDRDAGIRNATEARLLKHEESFDTKTLDDVLGVAVQQTFGIGLSYDFDHFDVPVDDADVSIHQLRARMAKSAIRRKRELGNAMRNELDTLRRLKNNVITPLNKEVAESEMNSVEQGIRERYADEIDRMKSALCTLIPTNADAPKGTERYNSPILIAQYVDLKAAPTRGEFTMTKEAGPDPITMIEDYVRKDFGDEAADAYRREEIAARQKEKEMLTEFRRQYGEMEDGDTS